MTDLQSFHLCLEDFVANCLPALNNDVESGRLDPISFGNCMKHLDDLSAHVRDTDIDNLTIVERRKFIQLLGFAVSSAERHFQGSGRPAGEALRSLPNLEATLWKVSKGSDHPPRDTHYTYWLWNPPAQPLTFTGDPQEVVFNRIVNHTHLLHSHSNDALRLITTGTVPITVPEAVEILDTVARNTFELCNHFRSFMEKADDRTRAMEPEFFMKRMRTYLPTYPIRGQLWGGVNAANLAAQMQIDYLVGTINEEYSTIIAERARYLTAEDEKALKEDMANPSVADLVLEQLGFSPPYADHLTEGVVRSRAQASSTSLQNVLRAFARVHKSASQLTAVHWSLIQNYLVKPATKMPPEAKARLAVQPDKGTGGNSHEATKAIMNMRRLHPIIGVISSAIATLA